MQEEYDRCDKQIPLSLHTKLFSSPPQPCDMREEISGRDDWECEEDEDEEGDEDEERNRCRNKRKRNRKREHLSDMMFFMEI